MDIRSRAQQIEPYIIERRRFYHAHPELTGMESATTFVVRMIFLILYPALTAGLVSASDELANKMFS